MANKSDRTTEIDVTNIGERERRVRQVLGYVFLVMAMGMAVLLLASNYGRGWRLMLLLPAFLGIRLLYDSRVGIDLLKAELGQERKRGLFTTFGDPIPDANRVDQIRRISRRAIYFALASAVVFTVVLLIVP